MKSYAVARVNLSPYQRPDFLQSERKLLESLEGIKYFAPTDLPAENEIILVTNTHTVLREISPKILNRTCLILHPNSGYDHFRDDQNLWNNIPVVVGHKIRAQAVAEYILGCLFEGMQEIPQHMAWNLERKWERTLLKGLDVCVFGHGHIGKIVTETLKTIGTRVTIVDPFKEGCAKTWKQVDLKKMKVVISCMGLNTTSKRLFNEEFFKNAHEELLFINGARGGLVDEKALKDFLLSHPAAFAFLDVFEKEPFGEEWRGFPQVWKTSHIAGCHHDLDQGILDFEYEVLADYLKLSKRDFMIKYQQEFLQNKWIQGELI